MINGEHTYMSANDIEMKKEINNAIGDSKLVLLHHLINFNSSVEDRESTTNRLNYVIRITPAGGP